MRRSSIATYGVPLALTGAVLMMLATPSAQRRRDDSAALGVPVSTNAIQDDPGSYLGKRITVSAAVEQVLSSTAFLVDQRKAASATAVQSVGKPILVIAPYLNKPLEQKKYLMMSGQLVKLDAASLARVAADYKLDLTPELSAKYQGHPVLVATSVVDSVFAELARKPLPPAMPEEVAMTAAMKTISSGVAALRTATQEAKADVVVMNAAALQPAFTSVEVIWDNLGQVPAAQIARDARTQAAAIEVAAKAGNWDAVKSSTAALNQTCGACHGAYRERQEDTTFRFKPGSF